MHDKLLQNICSKSFQNKTKQNTHPHRSSPLSITWLLLLESNGLWFLAFRAGGKKVGGVCCLFSLCLVFTVHLFDSMHNSLSVLQ